MPDTYLIFDTNGLPTRGSLDSGFWRALFHLCELKDIKPAISEVTLDEAVNMRRDAVNAQLKPYVAAHNELSKMTRMDPIYTPTGEGVAAEHEARLRSIFTVLPLEGVHAVEAFRREARRVVPARLGKGGRDSAIWLTIATLANAGHKVYFVTNNHKDFGRGGLFTELLDEVENAPQPIEYMASANELVDQIASKVDVPDLTADQISDAFSESIRSLVIGMLEEVGSAEYTVDRAWNASIEVEAITKGQGYEVDGQGLVHVRAVAKIADPTGVQWAKGLMSGWLNFEPGTIVAQPSELERLDDIEFR